jgi:molybdopterin converting factor subunit 1
VHRSCSGGETAGLTTGLTVRIEAKSRSRRLMAVGASVGYARWMRVRVLYFGVLRERLGGDQELLELTDGATVTGVLNVYRERVPGFAWDSIAVAVNQEYARAEVVLQDGDEVALLPPVSGGIEGQEQDAD